MALSRRDFLNRSSLAGGGDTADRKYRHAAHRSRRPRCSASPSYGPLVADPAGRLGLPAGSQYTIVTQARRPPGTTSQSRPTAVCSWPRTERAFSTPSGGHRRQPDLPLARNDIDDNEFTGPVYSLDRRVLFANLQSQSTMFAITGPWRRQPTR